jgi:hypothetical protein
VVAVLVAGAPGAPTVVVGVLVVLLLVQLGVVRPRLNRRSDRVLAGEDAPRSRLHLVYIGFEAVKVVALVVLGVLLLGGA